MLWRGDVALHTAFVRGAINSLPIYLLVFSPLLFRQLQHYKKSVALLVKRGEKVSRPQDFFLKGLFYFFFLLKF